MKRPITKTLETTTILYDFNKKVRDHSDDCWEFT